MENIQQKSLQETLQTEVFNIEKESVEIVPFNVIREVINIIKKIDKDMEFLLDIFIYQLENISDEKIRTFSFYKLLKFYGFFGVTDILKTRQKMVILKGTKMLVKEPFLKNKDRILINTLMEPYGVFAKNA